MATTNNPNIFKTESNGFYVSIKNETTDLHRYFITEDSAISFVKAVL